MTKLSYSKGVFVEHHLVILKIKKNPFKFKFNHMIESIHIPERSFKIIFRICKSNGSYV